jgi:hypothetical protein
LNPNPQPRRNLQTINPGAEVASDDYKYSVLK